MTGWKILAVQVGVPGKGINQKEDGIDSTTKEKIASPGRKINFTYMFIMLEKLEIVKLLVLKLN